MHLANYFLVMLVIISSYVSVNDNDKDKGKLYFIFVDI